MLDEELRAEVRVVDVPKRDERVDLSRIPLIGERPVAERAAHLASQREDRGRIGRAKARHQSLFVLLVARRGRFRRSGRDIADLAAWR